jgi:hypothetical protein
MDSMRQQDVPLFLAELIYPNQPFKLSPDITILRVRAQDVMWHKERLLNLAIDRLPSQYTKVAWIDADIIFPDERWYSWASGLLDAFDLIQIFERLEQQDNEGNFLRPLSGLAAYVAAGGPLPFKFDVSATWPGLGWAAKRDLVATHGLLDTLVLGGADTYMSLAAYNFGDTWSGWHVQALAPKLREAWEAWARPFFKDVQGRVGYVPTAVIQLGHGAAVNRRYVDRLKILDTYDYDPTTDIAASEEGVWRWSSSKPELHSAVSDYFEQRLEDASSVTGISDVAG